MPATSTPDSSGPDQLIALCARLRDTADAVLDDLGPLRSQVDPTDAPAAHLLDRLLIATDYARGCACLGASDLGPPIVPVARSLTENFLATCWVASSDDNARVAIAAGRREMARILRQNLRAGHASMRHRSTGADHTREFLADPAVAAEAKRPPRFDAMADAAGLRKLYDTTYGMQSVLSHAFATDILAQRQHGQMVHGQLSAALAILRCTHLVIVNRIRERRATTKGELEAILKIAL